MITATQRRQSNRKRTDPSVVRVRLKDQTGNARWATAYLRDLTDEGVGLSLMTPLQIGSMVVIRGTFGDGRTDVQLQADVKWCTEEAGGVYQVGLELISGQSGHAKSEWREAEPPPRESAPYSGDPELLDCYEIMQLSPKATADTVHRVHRILAQRYHPDTPDTGNSEMFIRVTAAAKILSDPEQRAKYDAHYNAKRQLQWKIFDQAEASLGPEAERAKRKGILGLLYAKAAHDIERAFMTAIDFEDILGCPREHLQAALWYLKGKGFIQRSDNGRFSITVAGFDEMESQSFTPEPSRQKLIEQGKARVA
ncbi:MAG: DnaJ domain-containing protein [Acidobacteriota bacterium]